MRKKVLTARGRPPGKYNSYDDIRLLEYLARISVKHGIDAGKFFSTFLDAFEHKEAMCGELSIECREKTRDYAIFLITNSHEVVAQFPISERLLKETSALKEFTYIIEREKNALIKRINDNKARYSKIKGLKTGMKRINVKARVLAISRPDLALTRYNDYVKFTNVTLTDETGTVKLTLWNDRINSLSINDMVEIENASVTAYKGETQLRIRRHSKLRVVHACNHGGVIIRELEHNPNLNSIVTRGHG